MADEKDFSAMLEEAKAEKAKTPKERLGEAALKAGLTIMGNTPPAEKKAKGGAIKAKGWGQARGAKAAKVY